MKTIGNPPSEAYVRASPPEGLVLREVAPGVSARDVQEKTEPTLEVVPELVTMSV